MLSTTLTDAVTVTQFFSQPVTASHWATDAFEDSDAGQNSASVVQHGPNGLDWIDPTMSFEIGDNWSFQSVADDVTPGVGGIIS